MSVPLLRRSLFGVALTLVSGLASAQMTYRLTELGTLGGSWSSGSAINDDGYVTGASETDQITQCYDNAGVLYCQYEIHAFLWNGDVIVDVGTLGGHNSHGNTINKKGQVVGDSDTDPSGTHAFLYTNGSLASLGTIDGNYSFGRAVNDLGQVVGGTTYLPFGSALHAFLYTNGSMIDLDPGTGYDSQALAINKKGQVMITSRDRIFLFSGGVTTDIGTLGGASTIGRGINASGQMTGWSDTTGLPHAFLYSRGKLKDLGTLGGTYSEGNAINDAGQVAGTSYTVDGLKHAFLYSKGLMKDLGTLGGQQSEGLALNGVGEVTGSSATGAVQHAFLYTGGQMLDLNDLVDPNSPLKAYVRLATGIAITDTGYILAVGTNSQTGTERAYVLKKIVQCVPTGRRLCN